MRVEDAGNTFYVLNLQFISFSYKYVKKMEESGKLVGGRDAQTKQGSEVHKLGTTGGM